MLRLCLVVLHLHCVYIGNNTQYACTRNIEHLVSDDDIQLSINEANDERINITVTLCIEALPYGLFI